MAKSRQDLLALADRHYTEVLGFRLQSLTELELSNLQSLWSDRYNKTKKFDLVMRRELLVVSLVDDNGVRLFQNNEVNLLANLRANVISTLNKEARKLNGLEDDEDAVEAYEKKLDATDD